VYVSVIEAQDRRVSSEGAGRTLDDLRQALCVMIDEESTTVVTT
jgi:hypothetical protein